MGWCSRPSSEEISLYLDETAAIFVRSVEQKGCVYLYAKLGMWCDVCRCAFRDSLFS